MTHTSSPSINRFLLVVVTSAALALSALPAYAQHGGRGGYHGRPRQNYGRHNDNRYRDNRHHGGGGGGLIAGALLGVVAGAVIANSAQRPPPDVVYSSPAPAPPPGVVYYDNNYPQSQDGY